MCYEGIKLQDNIKYFCSEKAIDELVADHNKNYEQINDLQVSVIEGGYIIPSETSDVEIISNGAPKKASYGGVVDSNLVFDELSQIHDGRVSSNKGGAYIGIPDKVNLQEVEYIDDKVVYLGDFRSHPAHFYLESLSRFWIFLKQKELTRCKVAYIGNNNLYENDFFEFFINVFGIDSKNVVHISKPTKFKTVIIPEQSFKLNLSWHNTYNNIIEEVRSFVKPAQYKKVYFTKLPKHTIGEDLAADLFKNNGYDVFLPEKLTMQEKIAILSGCEEFIAQNGSNAHYSLFCKPNTSVVVLNRSSDIHYVQTQIDQLRNLKTTYVDSFFDLLPVWLSIGPFSFGLTIYLKVYLDSRSFKYNNFLLKARSVKDKLDLIKRWYKVYSDSKKLALLQNKITVQKVSVKNVVEIIGTLLGKRREHCVDIKYGKVVVTERKVLNIFGTKIKYKVRKRMPELKCVEPCKGLNQEYIDKLIKKFKPKKKPVVKNMVLSMTTYPERMKDVHYAIFSILNQSIAPEKFILWLAREEFPNGEKDISANVLQFKKYGLEIRFTDAIRSFKKIVPALREFSDHILVSADDDIYYPLDWLENMYNAYLSNPNYIYANRLHEVKMLDGKICPYADWVKCITNYKPSKLNFPTSVAGILYPPNVFDDEAINIERFTSLCPNQDDVWVWVMAILNNKTFVTFENAINNDLVYVNPERELQISGESTLATSNLVGGGNDIQINNTLNFYNINKELKDE